MVPYQCKDIPQGLFRHRYTLAQKKGEPREENPLRLITVELLEFTRHIGLEGCGDVAHKMICEIRAIVKGESGIKLDVETLKSFVSKAGYGINWIRQMRNHQLAQSSE